MISITLPIVTKSEANLREHHHVVARRKKSQRRGVALALRPRVCFWSSILPCTVTLTRLSARTLDDDNLQSAFKAIRDQVAYELGVDDRDHRVKFEYGQERAKTMGIRIEIRRRTG
jgi:hypothetical protein